MKKLIWNDDMDIVYGVKNNFENEKDFVEHVNEEYQNIRGNQCLIGDVAIKCCISTGEGIEAESITPLDDTDIEINNYYIADVEEVE